MKKFLLITGSALLLTGCAASGPNDIDQSQVRTADEKTVANCTYLGDVAGGSNFYGFFAKPAYDSARQQALKEAAPLGATHLLIKDSISNTAGTHVTGRAYKCAEH